MGGAIEYINVSELEINPSNPRKISADMMKKLCTSLVDDSDLFKARPLLVNRIGGKLIVYGGCNRLEAARKIGMGKVPCVIEELDTLTMEKRIVRDNLNYAEWDYEALLGQIDMGSLTDLGLDMSQYDQDFRMPFEEEERKTDTVIKDKNIKKRSDYKKIIFIYHKTDYRIIRNELEKIREFHGLEDMSGILGLLISEHLKQIGFNTIGMNVYNDGTSIEDDEIDMLIGISKEIDSDE